MAALGASEKPALAHLFRHDEQAVEAMAAAVANALVHGSLGYPGGAAATGAGGTSGVEIGAGMFPDRQRR